MGFIPVTNMGWGGASVSKAGDQWYDQRESRVRLEAGRPREEAVPKQQDSRPWTGQVWRLERVGITKDPGTESHQDSP